MIKCMLLYRQLEHLTTTLLKPKRRIYHDTPQQDARGNEAGSH